MTSPTSHRDIDEYLADDERLQFSCEGRLGNGTTRGTVGATDRRLIFLSESGTFRDLRYEDVRSLESRTDTRLQLANYDYRLIVGGGVTLMGAAFIGAIGTSSGALAFVLVLVIAAGLGVIDYGIKRRNQYDGIELVEHPVQVIIATVEDGGTEYIEVPADRPIDTDLSRLLRAGN